MLVLPVLLMVPGAVSPALTATRANEDLARFPVCTYCGMDRSSFAFSRMLIEYDDGTAFGSCSLHCAALNLVTRIDGVPESILVADYNSKKLIDAESAYWVIGGSKPGVMTRRAKWAFQHEREARAFISENGGRLGTFDDAMKAAFDDMFTDSRMIRSKRKFRKMAP